MVICIDEADVITTKADSHNAANLKPYTSTAKTILTNIDKIKKNPLIVLVATTNHIEQFDKAIVDRFESNIIEIPNPNGQMRKEVINFYINEINLNLKEEFKLNEKQVLDFVKKTKGISIRGIRGMVYYLYRNPSTNIDELTSLFKSKTDSKPGFTTNEKIGMGSLGLSATGILVSILLHRNPPPAPARI